MSAEHGAAAVGGQVLEFDLGLELEPVELASVYTGRCAKHGTPVTVECSRADAAAAGYLARATCCDRYVCIARVIVTRGTRACGEYCASATGKTCTCICGGRSHGLTWRVR